MKKRKKLVFEEREVIETMLREGHTQRSIVKRLNRAPSTISKEINLNSQSYGYVAYYGSMLARERQSSAKRQPRKMTTGLKKRLKALLKKDYSPEQVSGLLHEQGINISHETIYQWVWANKHKGGKLYLRLRRKGRRYRKRGALYQNRGQIKHRVDIDERPDIVEERSRVGDWEIDSIVGKHHKGIIVSMVEHKTRFTKLAKLECAKAAGVAIALVKKLWRFKHCIHSITSDNGKELANHCYVTNALNTDFFFAKPYSPWQRGTNENTNGLVRQYLPKGTDFSTVTHKQVQRIEGKLNNRPRKFLGYKTPKEMMDYAMAS